VCWVGERAEEGGDVPEINVALGGMWYIIFVFSVTLHETAHGFVAYKKGDPTAHSHGLVTLDPTRHILRSPFGMVLVPIISFALNGWMIGWASTPYDVWWAQRHRKAAAQMAAAGPLANLLLVVLAGAGIRAGMALGYFYPPDTVTFAQITAATQNGAAGPTAVILSILFSLNLLLFVFNLIPLPPLDGSGIVTLFMSEETAEKYTAFLSQPGAALIGLIVAWQAVGFVMMPVRDAALKILYPGLTYTRW
jgi:Zn-dependent protease